MTPQLFLATSLAGVLIGIPLGFVAWALGNARRGATNVSHGSSDVAAPLADNSSWLLRRWARTAYFGCLGLSVVLVGLMLARGDFGMQTVVRSMMLYLFAAGLAAAAPWRPILGPLAYIVVSYALPREDPVTLAVMSTGGVSMLTVLSVGALAVGLIEQGRLPELPRNGAVWALLAFSFWTGIVVLVAMWNGHPISDDLCHRTARIVQSIVLFLTVYFAKPALNEVRVFVAAASCMLIARAVRFTDGVRLEQNLAALIAVTVPWTVALAVGSRGWVARIGGGLLALSLAGLVALIANRGAFLGLAGAVLATWAVAHWKWRIAAACTPVFLLFALLLPRTTIGQRIDAAYSHGNVDESAVSRLEIWSFGVELARQHPIFGVGPENYAHYLREYFWLQDSNFGAHNIFVDVVAEMGYPGLTLFVVFWCSVTGFLMRAIGQRSHDATWFFLVGSLASVGAYLVAGTFLSLASLTFIYVLTGLSLGIADASLTPVPRSLAAGTSPTTAGRNRSVLGRAELDFVTLLYAGFVVIGSLTPFESQTVGLAEAGRQFLALRWWPPDFSRRVDTVSNVTLFVPLGFLFMGSLTCDVKSRVQQLAAAALVLTGAVGFGASVEYLQCWFPQRTTSANDVVAQLIGTIIGIGLWTAVGQRAADLWRQWRTGRADLSASQKAIVWYSIGLLLWWCWPLQLSLHPVDLYHKFRDGYLSPSYYSDYATPFDGGAYSVVARLLLPAPMGWFLSSAWRRQSESWRSWQHVLWLATAAAVGIEMMRVMTHGQIASGDQVLVSFAGILVGAVVHRQVVRIIAIA